MAKSMSARLSLDEVRASVKRVRKEGERLVDRIQKDARALAATNPAELLGDARKRAQTAVEQFETQRARIEKTVTKQVNELVMVLRKRLGAASTHDVDVLTRRVADLERQVDALTKKPSESAAA